MTRSFRTACFLLAAFAAFFGVFGCSVPPLDAAFEASSVEAAAENMIALLNERDYDGAVSHFSDQLKSAVPAETLSSTFDPLLDRLGAFRSIKESVLSGAVEEETAKPYAVAVVICRYENGSAQYTLSFDTEYQLIGIFIK